jgi:Leucine-rich repeat (LRR) protein
MARNEAYREAEQKIEQAEHRQAKELNISGHHDLKLTKLPESLGKLTNLQSLNLSNNQLVTLPEWFPGLQSLQVLNLSNNRLETLPESLVNLNNLQSLNLTNNQLTSLPEGLGEIANLESLHLFSNELKILPDSLGQLIKLKVLDLTKNKLEKLPESAGQLKALQSLDVRNNQLTTLPESIGSLTNLTSLFLDDNQLSILPYSIGSLNQLSILYLGQNRLVMLPDSLGGLKNLQRLDLSNNKLSYLPEALNSLKSLQVLIFSNNKVTMLSEALSNLVNLRILEISNNMLSDLPASLVNLAVFDKTVQNYCKGNPFNPELKAAYQEGINAIKAYLHSKAAGQIILNEAKLIIVGEGEVGKTCLMDALLGKEWQEHPSTHGIEIHQVKVTDRDTNTEIALNGWDFGGQPVYRPTHQLFFSAPAVYLVVWKPREGPQQGLVKEWIQLVKRREPTAKILVVATHGGPHQRQPDIDRQELWDFFGRDTVVDFFHVESKPDEQGERRGIDELKYAIARVAATLPEVRRAVPKRWQKAREAIAQTQDAYLPLQDVLSLCHAHQMDNVEAALFITIEHRLGHLIHYQHDPTLRDIVVLKPNWLATAISFVLDDEVTRRAHGLVRLSRLSQLWNDQTRAAKFRYDETLHPIFLRLMERFDISYRVADPSSKDDSDPLSLIAQLVPHIRPDNIGAAWSSTLSIGDIPQTQICRIVDAKNGQSASAEGLFYQLIVRLHKYSLGRVNYNASVHWQRGLVLEDEYKNRAFLEHVGNDIRITVRSPYPEGLLGMLTREVKFLVESFWEGLRCDVMVPCIEPCGKNAPGIGLYNVSNLIESKRDGQQKYPCPTCNKWQDIDSLLRNAPAAAKQISLSDLQAEFDAIKDKLDRVDVTTRRTLSQVDKTYTDLLHVLTNEAKEGPRLFSFFPVDRSNFNPKEWIRAKFRLVLWCEHSRLPLSVINGANSTKGVYDLDLDREWFKKSAPYLKFLTGTLGMVLPVASSSIKLALDETAYKLIEEQLDFGKSVIAAAIGTSGKIEDFISKPDATNLEHGVATQADGSTLRELHALLKAKDPGFGGLVRVVNKRQEFLWVHEKFASEY